MREVDIHNAFIAWLRKHKLPYTHHRMDKKSGIQEGACDFIVQWCGRATNIEVKTLKGRISLKQAEYFRFLRFNACPVVIARSVEECIEAVKNILCEGKLVDEATPIHERPRFTKQFTKLKEAVRKVPGNGTDELKKRYTDAGWQALRDEIAAPKGLQPKFAIANWGGVDYVMAPALDNQWCKIRVASPADIINFPRLVA